MAKKRSKKRGNGEGSVFPLKNGKWRATLTVGWTDLGKPIRISRTAKSHADGLALLREMQAEAGKVQSASRQTVMDYLRNWLLEVGLAQEENTSVSYKNSCEKHIIPRIGRTPLRSLKPAHVRAMLSELSKANVGGRTVENAFVVLRTALNAAVRDGELESNPCASIKKPKHEPKEIFPFTLEESRRILKATETHRIHALFVLAFSTGLRSAELFGLEWDDIDFLNQALYVDRQATSISGKVVVKPPKSQAGKRRIELAEVAIHALEDRRRLAVKEGHAASSLVFPNRKGDHIQRGVFRTRIWNVLLKRLGLTPRGFHHVRHTYACLALADGVPLPTVSQILGHAKQETTLKFYSRHLPGHQKSASESAARLFG